MRTSDQTISLNVNVYNVPLTDSVPGMSLSRLDDSQSRQDDFQGQQLDKT